MENTLGHELEERLGYRFRDRSWLDRALTHASLRCETTKVNERLEFLGDAVLGLAAADFIDRNGQGLEPGWTTRARAAAVSEASLAFVAERLGIEEFVRARGITRLPRKILADAFEALIGAVFLDGGLGPAQDLTLRLLGPTLMKEIANPGGDTRSALQHIAQSVFAELPEYIVVAESGPPHDREFDVLVRVHGEELGRASGRTKKQASQRAASVALERLRARAGARRK